MKITILNDNTAGKVCGAEHGLSFLVEADQTILFDTGPSDIIVRNANILGIDLKNVDAIVLSHGHWDHANGLMHLRHKPLILHPDAFLSRYRKSDHSPLGMPASREELARRFEIIESKEPYLISEELWFLGEIPRMTNFEAKETPFELENGSDDFVPDDSGMVVLTEHGLVVISGCAHAGICNMVLHAQKVIPGFPVYAVIGGFHLTSETERIEKTIAFMKEHKITRVIPSHCTGLPALARFYQEFGFMQVRTGQTIIF